MAEGDGSFRNLSAPPLGLLEHASLKMRPIQNPIQQSTRQITPERIVEVPRICIKRKFKLDAIQKRCPQNFCLPRDLLTKFCSHFAPKACQPEVRIQLRHSREQHCSISLDSEARRTLDQAGKLAFGLIIALLSPHPGDVALAAGHAEPGNALSIPTWYTTSALSPSVYNFLVSALPTHSARCNKSHNLLCRVIHISSVIEWTTAMILMWRYAEVTGTSVACCNPAKHGQCHLNKLTFLEVSSMGAHDLWSTVAGNEKWKGMTWGMMPLFTGALTACTYHFFYNSPDIDFLVAIQASLTWIGNATLWLAAYRIFKDTESPSPS